MTLFFNPCCAFCCWLFLQIISVDPYVLCLLDPDPLLRDPDLSHQAKIVRTTWFILLCDTSLWLLSLIEMYRYLQKVLSRQTYRIQIYSISHSHGSADPVVPKCHRIRNTVHNTLCVFVAGVPRRRTTLSPSRTGVRRMRVGGGPQPPAGHRRANRPSLRWDAVLRIRDPVPSWPLDRGWEKNQDPGSGMGKKLGSGSGMGKKSGSGSGIGKKSGSGSGMNNLDHIFRERRNNT